MRTIDDYRAGCLIILGDTAGRRYAESVLDMGFREALAQYKDYCPRKEVIKQTISETDGKTIILPAFLAPDTEILTVRDENGNWLDFSEYRTGEKIYLTLYDGDKMPQPGTSISLELTGHHTIKGLDNASVTTIPDGHALMLCTGAAGYSMRIRARSVTEVFGKRPEDREALSSQANRLLTDFSKDLYLNQTTVRDALPRGGFEI